MKLSRKEIERIIENEIVVDCYTEEEVAMGWAVYMERLSYPFEAEYYIQQATGKN